jgi:multidrug efflux pump subunit AcrB
MGFIEFPIRRFQFTLVAFLMLAALGYSAFKNIPRSEDPNFPISAFVITAIYPGAEPVDIERTVAKRIEDVVNELDDVKSIETTARDSVAVVVVEFIAGVDVQKKYDEVVREMNGLRPELPSEMTKLEVRKINPGLVNIVQLALVSTDAPYSELQTYARELKDAIKGAAGVRTAESWAFPARELRIELDLLRMGELGITTGAVLRAVQSENANVPGGSIDAGSQNLSIRTSGFYRSLEEVRDTVVGGRDGRAVRIRDLAEVRWDEGQHNHLARFNGERAVYVTANQKDNENIFKTRAAIETKVQEFQRTLPPRISLHSGFEQSENVANRLNRLGIDFVLAISLVLITLLPLGLRAAGVVAIAIPLSLAIGVAALYFLGYSLNQLSIAGFVVALGLLVDDSIVVVENIERHLRTGMSRTAAAIAGTRQIFVAVIGCTATLIFAFVPLLVLPGNAGKFIASLPMAVVVTVLASLLVALTIIPFLASRILKPHANSSGNWLLQRLMAGIQRFYSPLLERALRWPKMTVLAAFAFFLATLALLPTIGFSLFPKADTPQFLITIETAEGSSLAETDRALRFVEDELRRMPEVKTIMSNLGKGNPKMFYNIFPRDESSNLAEVFVILSDFDTRSTPRQIEALRQRLADFPNARILVKEFENGPPIDAPIAIRVLGQDLDVLRSLSGDIEQIIANTEGTRNIDNPMAVTRTNLKLEIDTQKAGLLGVATVDLDRAVRLAMAGLNAGRYRDSDGEDYDIILRAPMDGRPRMQQLEQVLVPTLNGSQIPLAQLATLQFQRSPTEIQRFDRERQVLITAYTHGGFNTDKVTQEILTALDNHDWPRGYHYKAAGEVESRQESFSGLGTAAIIAVFGIFAVLVLEFGSFKSTLIVLTVVPLGVTGGILALWLTGNSLSFTAIIGFIALIGIEIKNSILLVDFTNQLREQGHGLDEAIAEAGEVRFLPILLTSATAIGGLLPLAIQNIGLYSPMSWVIIGGLISSTVLARLVTPVMYKLLPPVIGGAECDACATDDEARVPVLST